jgi:hypothetical protein
MALTCCTKARRFAKWWYSHEAVRRSAGNRSKTRSLPSTRPSRISDGDAVSRSGFVGIGTPEELITALGQRFIDTKRPVGPEKPMGLAATPQDLQLTDCLSGEEDRSILFTDFDGMAPQLSQPMN